MSKRKFRADKHDDDNPDSSTNGQRADAAEFAVESASRHRKEAVTIDEDGIADLFTDLCHLCDREKLSAHKLIARAKRNWRAER